MLSLFDVVDDTKLVQKAILDELVKSLNDLAKDSFGRKVLFYLLSPRDPLHFHPDVVAVLKQGDGNAHSKKEAVTRHGELLTYLSRDYVKWIVEHAEHHVTDNSLLLLILSVVQHVKCDPTEAIRAVAQLAARPFEPGADHLVEHPAGHLTLKRLVLNDAQRMRNGELALFSSILLDVVPTSSLRQWTTCNRGCFLIISMLEVGNETVARRIHKQLTSEVGTIASRDFKGAHILADKLRTMC